MDMDGFNLFEGLFTSFQVLLNNWIGTTVANSSTAVVPVARSLMIIYVIMWGIGMIRGLIDEPVIDGLMRFLKISIVIGFALNVGLYNTFIVEAVQQIPMQMAATVGGTDIDPENAGQYGPLMDAQLSRVIDMASGIADEGSILRGGFMYYLLALFLITFGSLLFIGAGLLIVTAQIGTAVMLGIGPIFLLFALFEKTNFLFEGWMRQTLMFMMRLFFLVLLTGLFLSIFEQFINHGSEFLSLGDFYLAAVVVALVSLVLCLLLAQTSEMAASITGGVAMSAAAGASKLTRSFAIGRIATLPTSSARAAAGIQHATRNQIIQR